MDKTPYKKTMATKPRKKIHKRKHTLWDQLSTENRRKLLLIRKKLAKAQEV